MKKTYEKPAIVKSALIQQIAAAPNVSGPGGGGGVPN